MLNIGLTRTLTIGRALKLGESIADPAWKKQTRRVKQRRPEGWRSKSCEVGNRHSNCYALECQCPCHKAEK